jgi:hypothetical protein
LRQHDQRHELDRLKLGAGEGTGEQAERDPEQRVDGSHCEQPAE